jgi:hypothetical protein
VIGDRPRPFISGALAPEARQARVAALRDDPRFEFVFEEDG